MAGDGDVPFVGLTGGMGSGKSTALAALARLGAATISSDEIVHELYAGADVRDAVVARFGEGVAPGGGPVDRAALAQAAFATPEGREWLERLIWPRVGARVAQWLAQARAAQPRPRAAVVEVPLLFEADQQSIYDATIAVVADERVRRERAAGRGHELLDERVARQLPQEEKAARATYVVRNDGSLDELQAHLSEVLGKLEGG